MRDARLFRCYECYHEWSVPHGTGQSGLQMKCPKCGSADIHRAEVVMPGRGRGPNPAGRGRRGPGRGRRLKE